MAKNISYSSSGSQHQDLVESDAVAHNPPSLEKSQVLIRSTPPEHGPCAIAYETVIAVSPLAVVWATAVLASIATGRSRIYILTRLWRLCSFSEAMRTYLNCWE